jgi:hypothetical protein
MNLGKLSKRLRKELLANPKQALVLAIVSLVACWFWLPLLMNWFKGKPKVATVKAEPAAVESVTIKTEPQRPWFYIHRWRQADPLTRSASASDTARDPFRLPKPVASAQKETNQQPTEQAEVVPVEPQKLNLTLEAIVYSGSRRLARINGQTVLEGEELSVGGGEVDGEDEPVLVKGKVVAIDPTAVDLDFSGQAVQLRLQPKLLGRGEVIKRLKTQ